MSSPFGHHHHHHHHNSRREEEEEEERRRREAERQHHHPHYQPPGHHPAPAYLPPPPVVQHVYHEVGHGSHGGHFFPHVVHHESHHIVPSHHGGGGGPSNVKTVRIYPKAGQDYSLSVRNGQVILAPSNYSDDHQHWIKDEKYSTKVKDEEGLPCFALINKVTGQAIKHSIGATHPVRLIPNNADYLDESILWTESKDTGENFRCIRMVNNIRLNFDAFHGDKDHGGVHDGTTIVLWEWLKGDNQRWKIVPY